MKSYYNDNDPDACAWLRGLISAGLIPPGDVDQRSIADVQPADLDGYTQAHFFCGIAGWPLALQLAGVGPDVPLWTGSAPCQPFSSAGKQKGTQDHRHLWPEMFRLIRACRPPLVMGEQVAAKQALGWLDGVFDDLESQDYTCWACDTCAPSVGAYHIRQRLYWIAGLADPQHQPTRGGIAGVKGYEGQRGDRPAIDGDAGGLGHAPRIGRDERRGESGRSIGADAAGTFCWTPCTCCDDYICNIHGMHAFECDCPGIDEWVERWNTDPYTATVGQYRRLVNAQQPRLEGHAGHGDDGNQPGRERADATGSTAEAGGTHRLADAATHMGDSRLDQPERGQEGRTVDRGNNPWASAILIPCRDGKYRPVAARLKPPFRGVVDGLPPRVAEPCPDLWPLAPTTPGRAKALKGLGNAIVPQLAAEFIRAYMEASK